MSSDEDDDELMAAAGKWAEAADSEVDSSPKKKKKTKKNKKQIRDKPKEGVESSSEKTVQTPIRTEKNATSKVYSLHLTQVPYEATQTDIRCAFGEKGCHITSVRLVYDHDSTSGERHFRGVAFVDLADEASYKRGLELHGTKVLGKKHKINVRPTRTKGELSEIVRKTQEKVAILIARSKEKAREERSNNLAPDDRKKRKLVSNPEGETQNKKSKRGRGGNAPKDINKKNVSSMESSKSTPRKKRHKSKDINDHIKLTKKQRAKKAAVINMIKRKKMK